MERSEENQIDEKFRLLCINNVFQLHLPSDLSRYDILFYQLVTPRDHLTRPRIITSLKYAVWWGFCLGKYWMVGRKR